MTRRNERLRGILRSMAEPRGAYRARRAAALSGVPLSTVHYWAREGILSPSVSTQRVKLWSWSDLMSLRLIYWLRRVKVGEPGRTIPATSMPVIREALRVLADLDLELWSEEGGPAVAVDQQGGIVLETPDFAQRTSGQAMVDAPAVDLLRPFATEEGTRGPDLLRPRPTVRILPGKLGGSPHVLKTRIETVALGALALRGLSESKILRLYPAISVDNVRDSIALERQLSENLNEPLLLAA